MNLLYSFILYYIILYIIPWKCIFNLLISDPKILERPAQSKHIYCGFENILCNKSSNGFPSIHSLLSAFTLIYWTRVIIIYFKKNNQRIILLLPLWIWLLCICYSRYVIHCHTKLQIISGFFIGSILGISVKI
jgi:membrane-associated phospholipid phosphatase